MPHSCTHSLALCLPLVVCSFWTPGPDRAGIAEGAPFFRIEAIDKATGRGVPLVCFTATSGIAYYTDSAGLVAFHEPGLMGKEVYFQVSGDGYEIGENEIGERGLTLTVENGASATVELTRRFPAQRLYRVTGLAPYRDSILLGEAVPSLRPPLQSNIMGQDSVFVERYRGGLFWIWGDTLTPGNRYDWNVEVTAATSELPSKEGMDPDVGVCLHYLTDDGENPKKMISPEFGGAMTWLDGLVNLKDATGEERLFAHYVQMRRLPDHGDSEHQDEGVAFIGMFWADDRWAEAVELERRGELGERAVKEYQDRMRTTEKRYTRVSRGLLEYDNAERSFEFVTEFPEREVLELHIGAHPFRAHDGETEYVYFPGLFANRRVRADIESIKDINRYESFTCLKEGSRFNNTEEQLERSKDGVLHYSWKPNTSPIGPAEQRQLVEAKHIRPEERWIVFRDVETGNEIDTQHNTIAWSPHRNRWIGLFTESVNEGTEKNLGETWYTEADSPLGPWAYMRKVVSFPDTHYSFYNPCLHPWFNQRDGQIVYFEGTFTRFMSKGDAIPRYDYNQLMYKLDLDDPRLFLPVPVYELQHDGLALATNHDISPEFSGDRNLAFFAPDRPREGTVPVYELCANGDFTLTTNPPASDKAEGGRTAFYAERATGDHSPCTVPLYEHHDIDTGVRTYSTSLLDEGLEPICYVWESPSTVNPFSVEK